MYGDPLTDLERDALAAILSPAHPIMDALRAQAAECRIKSREFTGVGFFTELVVPARTAVDGLRNAALTGTNVQIEGLEHGATFVLFIEDGMITTLEGVTFTEPWPEAVGAYQITRDLQPTRLEPRAWARWWRLTGRKDLDRLLRHSWDPIGLDDEWPDDEYDCMADPLAEMLRRGASIDEIARALSDHRIDHFGAPADPDSDQRVAAALISWYWADIQFAQDRHDG